MSILEKLKSQIEHLCDLSFEWTDSRCFWNSIFSEWAWSQKELPCNFFLDELVWHTLSNWLFLKCHSHNSSMFCDIVSSWKWFACISKMSILENYTHKLSTYVTYLLNEQIQDVSQYHFLRIIMITNCALEQIFLYMNWFNMFFQIDIFKKS